MPLEILLMIIAFLAGIAFNYLKIGQKSLELFSASKKVHQGAEHLRNLLYQITIIYLLFKIGFVGGSEVIGEPWQSTLVPGLIVVIAASVWTILLLILLNRWSSFNRVTQISIASHFGSVSVGTFIAALEFMKALGIAVNPSVAIWLALMEIPAVFIGMWKLGVRPNTIVPILREQWSLAVLPISILIGVLVGNKIPAEINSILFGAIFTPILLYFLFEMGRKAADSLNKLKGKISSVIFVGFTIPILGGFFGSSIGHLLGYDTGETFIIAILMASASYVLAPLCMQEVLESIYRPNRQVANQVVATSMALSAGLTLPFNILVGFEVYHLMIQGMKTSPEISIVGLTLPFVLLAVSLCSKPRISE